jgi:hypothetical protein
VPKAPVIAAPSSAPVAMPVPASSPAAVLAADAASVAARFADPAVDYRTPAFEPGRSAFTSNAELRELMHSLQRDGRRTPDRTTIKVLPLGSSQTGVPIEALLFTRGAATAAEAIARSGRPAVLLVAQQHGDEPAGCEALIVIAHELAHGALQALLDRIDVIVLPRANPDGARDATRTTASGIDANRDHLLLKTPEAQAMARLAREYQPAVVADLHEYVVSGLYREKFGAQQRADALVQYTTTANLPEFIGKASEEWFRQPLLASLKTADLRAEWYHTTSDDVADKKVSMGGAAPDTSRNVNGLRNAVSLLIESRGVGLGRLYFKRRVHTHVTAASSVLRSAAARAADLVKLRQFVDSEVSAMACQGEAVVQAETTPSEYTLQMLDPVSGADKAVTVTWNSALQLRPVKLRARPCGYWLAADQTDAVLRLRSLGVQVQQLAEMGVLRGETYREAARVAQTVPTLIDVDPGSYYVALDQPLAHLVLAALEPDTPYSYLAQHVLDSAASEARVMTRPELKMTAVP